MADMGPQAAILPIGSIGGGHLTTAAYSSVFNSMLLALPRIRAAGSVSVELMKLAWIDHMPLLALALLVDQCGQMCPDGCVLDYPADRAAFLKRWGVFNLLDELGIDYSRSEDVKPYEEAQHSRVMPIRRFRDQQGAGAVRDLLLKAEGKLLDVLRKQAFLEDGDVSALAELVVFELCKNVVEHSRSEGGGFAIAHASTPSSELAEVRNRLAAPWEKNFYAQIADEGATEIVLGDAGVGIVESLRAKAKGRGVVGANEILEHAFDPYSTSKKNVGRKTRGLWCVKQKVRDLGGLLYVRTCSGVECGKRLREGLNGGATPPLGVAAYWDFLNNPEQDKPIFVEETSWFPGTQFQILLPQHNHVRPRTYVALHTLDGVRKKAVPKPFTVPSVPSNPHVENSIRAALRNTTESEVLFVDMSVMGPRWDRDAVGKLMEVVRGELVSGRERRVWLLMQKANEGVLEMMRVSTAVKDLWKEQGIMIPVVKLKDPLSLPPDVFPVLADTKERSGDSGDTVLARERLVEGLWTAVERGRHMMSEIVKGLTRSERAWLDDTISRNFAIAYPRRRLGKLAVVPQLAIDEVARTAGMMLLGSDLRRRIDQQIARLRQKGDQWYQLTSGVFCDEYIDEGVWRNMDAWLRNRIDCWVEERVQAISPKFVVTYTDLGNALMARALQSNPGTHHILLGNYLDLHGPRGLEKLDSVSKGDVVALLLDITGSGKTIEKLLANIENKQASVRIISLIDTVEKEDFNRRPKLARHYKAGKVDALVRYPVKKIKEVPSTGPKSHWPIIRIDPVTLQPIPEVFPAEKLMKDGEFWRLVARTGTLSVPTITFKGHEFSSFIWLTGLFDDDECACKLVEHLRECFGKQPPDMILITEETGEFLSSDSALLRKLSDLSADCQCEIWVEGRNEMNDNILLNKRVAIFTGAATSGSGIARLMKRCGLAARVHICAFIDRMSSDIASTFVQKHNATFMAFQRLRNGSPSLRHRSYRAAALRSLAQYRRSCLSNRLLLFADEMAAVHQDMHATVESPVELRESSDILAQAIQADVIDPNSSFNVGTPSGVEAIAGLIQQWESERGIGTLLKAILEEACCRYEAQGGEFGSAEYLETVKLLYQAKPEEKLRDKMRELVLTVMILERLPGERFQLNEISQKFGKQLWEAFGSAATPGTTAPDAGTLGPVYLRCCAKLNPTLILDNLADAVRRCSWSRVSELTLAFELSKMRDEARLAGPLIEALGSAAKAILADGNSASEVSIAFRDLLRDLGFAFVHGSVVPMQWDEIHRLLAEQQPDKLRTVRAVIRTLRQVVPKASIGYFQRMGGNRFLLVDAWPPLGEKSSLKFPTTSKVVQQLVGTNDIFFTPDLSAEQSPTLSGLYERMCNRLEKKDLTWSWLFAELSAGESAPDKRNVFGLFRLSGVFKKGATPIITSNHFEEVRAVLRSACQLMGRPQATHVAKIGAWQFEHAVGGFGQGRPAATGREATLKNLGDLMVHLLGADIGRVALYEAEEHKWKSGPLSGLFWGGSRETIEIEDTDQGSITVKAAAAGKPVVLQDVQSGNYPPNSWVHSCVVLPLVREGSTCKTVVTLWHHVPGWFGQFKLSLLESLVAIGGARLFALENQEAQRMQEEGLFIKGVAARLGHVLSNQLQESDFKNLANAVPSELKPHANKCLKQVKNAHRLRSRLVLLARKDAILPDNQYSSQALFHAIEPTLRETAAAYELLVEECRHSDFNGRVDYFKEALQLDVVEFVVNSVKHGQDNTNTKVNDSVTVAMTIRTATAEEVAISPHLTTSAKGRMFAALEYRDTGVGVHPNRKRSLFERTRLNEASEGSNSLGLGMPLARLLARRFGGDLVECGEYGKGAKFLLFMPIK